MNINDIARLAGVSASTVSKVMNGKDKDISEETKKKVLKTIEQENYVPYLKYREKEGLKNHLIGLLIRRDNRERENIVMCTERAVRQKGYNLIINYMDSGQEVCEHAPETAGVSGRDRDHSSRRALRKTPGCGGRRYFKYH